MDPAASAMNSSQYTSIGQHIRTTKGSLGPN
uniref:Uncharacterized protein n=1 Tax=Rhizophora mucronata TaxID=61149 RepID=A0A2P2JJ62_RHIMU